MIKIKLGVLVVKIEKQVTLQKGSVFGREGGSDEPNHKSGIGVGPVCLRRSREGGAKLRGRRRSSARWSFTTFTQ